MFVVMICRMRHIKHKKSVVQMIPSMIHKYTPTTLKAKFNKQERFLFETYYVGPSCSQYRVMNKINILSVFLLRNFIIDFVTDSSFYEFLGR